MKRRFDALSLMIIICAIVGIGIIATMIMYAVDFIVNYLV